MNFRNIAKTQNVLPVLLGDSYTKRAGKRKKIGDVLIGGWKLSNENFRYSLDGLSKKIM